MIHNLAFVQPEASLGKGVVIEPFSTIASDVEIGEGAWIGPNVTIMDGARIGKNCKIFPGAVISAIPQDMKYMGEKTTAEIGNNTIIRECVTLNRGTVAAGKTIVGKNCLLMAYVHVAHDCMIGNNCILVNNVGLAGEVVVDDWAILSGSTMVHQFVHIGKHSIIGGGSKVRIDVPPYITADREPLAYIGVNSVGLRRRKFSNDKINEIQDIYRAIYLKNLNTTQALEEVEKEFSESIERDEILNFFRNSSRGVIRTSTK